MFTFALCVTKPLTKAKYILSVMKSMSMLKLVAAISIVICVGVGVYFFGVKSDSKREKTVGNDMGLMLR